MKRNIRIPWKYRKVFSRLARDLILVDKRTLFFSTIDQICEYIELDFIAQYNSMRKRYSDSQKDFMKAFKIIDNNNDIVSTHEFTNLEEEISYFDKPDFDLSESQFIVHHTTLLTLISGDNTYHPWAFTPKLTQNSEQEFCTNCFGSSAILGAYYRSRGIKVQFGITPDHPCLIINLDDDFYICDNGGMYKALGLITDYGAYKIYKPSDSDEEKFSGLIIIFPFSRGLLYEILENMEVLRRISSGEHKVKLPGSQQKGLELVLRHQKLLNLCDWKELQSHIFSDLAQAFITHDEEWNIAVKKTHDLRSEQYGGKVLNEIFTKAQGVTDFAKLPF